jgi:hypothetical protein
MSLLSNISLYHLRSGRKTKTFHLLIIIWIIGLTSLHGCGTPIVNRGLQAKYPEQRFYMFFDMPPASFVPVDSLQPILKWESFPPEKDLTGKTKIIAKVRDVTYQLRIMTDGWFYSKDDLREPYHRIEVPLKPSTQYLWTVRACFKLDDEPRCTTWGAVSDWEYWSFQHPNFNSYRFKTPER